jgi:acyl-CoA reductase-like NAD-dependent aldehyde dehydrogenase
LSDAQIERRALLLVDVQRDFLERPGLSPAEPDLVLALRRLLEGWRARGWPVVHVRTCTQPDGSGRMPHWQIRGVLTCVADTPGYEPPEPLAALADEPVLHKQFFSAFDCTDLLPTLRQAGVDTLVVAGLYTHGCVRATVLDAYALGFEVLVADEAIASTEAVHAELSRQWLNGRAAVFASTARLLGRAHAVVPGGGSADVGAEVGEICAAVASAAGRWARTLATERAALLERWADRLERETDGLVRLLAVEIGKPVSEGGDELRRALAHIRTAATLAREPTESAVGPGVTVRRRPVGTVALITPWNNPLAIPAGKLAAALAFGNGCVWKPSPRAPASSARLRETLFEAGLPPELAVMVTGGADAARALVLDPHVDAVSLTASNTTGKAIAALCAASHKPLQAELGGNNAALILDDWAFDDADLMQLARAVYGFAGQRCTAIRRLIVQRGAFDRFTKAFGETVAALRVGEPLDPATQVGPLISAAHRARTEEWLEAACRDGARILARASLPEAIRSSRSGEAWADSWFAPTLLGCVRPESAIAREETFGPVAMIMSANDLPHAVALANAVPQGLVAALHSRDVGARAYFAERIEAGLLKLAPGPLLISAEAPFCGWKSSAIGPAEHGAWDRDFYTRVQTLYR